jgi:transcriptional regulator with XRE-family HTH domain
MRSSKELLGARIKKFRKASGLSQEQLAELVGIEQKHVSRLELGKNAPTIDRLEKIAAALNVPMGSFFDSGNQEANAERAAKIERMVRELDEDYRRIILKFSEILNEFKEK